MSEEQKEPSEFDEGVKGKSEEETFPPKEEPVYESPISPGQIPPPVQPVAVMYPEMQPQGQQELTAEELERKRKRRRNWWLIGTLGIALPILIVVSLFIFMMLALIGAFESCAVNCCESCANTCTNTCEETCCDSCSESCSNACNCSECCDTSDCCDTSSCCSSSNISRITIIERLSNFKNQLKWILNILFGLF